MAKGSEVVPASAIGERFPVLGGDSSEFAAIMEENFGSDGVLATDLDQVKIPSGGALNWAIPTLEGEDAAKALEGVIVAWNGFRTYWETSLDDLGSGEKSPPDCSSDDSIVGHGAYGPGSDANPTGLCESCPMNEWGSAEGGKGKACKEGRQLYLLREGAVLPLSLSLPPTSIVPLRKFFLRLAGQGVPYYGVVVSITLEKQTSGQFTYGVIVPKVAEVLDPSARQVVKEYGEQFKKGLRAPTPAAQAEAAGVGE